MTRAVFLIALFLIINTESKALSADSVLYKRISELAAQVQKKYAPDKRTEYFQVRVQIIDPLTYIAEATNQDALNELKRSLNRENLPVKLILQTLPLENLGEKIYGITNLSVINNRYSPGHSAEMATQSILGTPVKVLKKEKGFYLVRTPDNYLSYTESAGISLMNKAELETWQSANKIVYTDAYGQAYSEASETSSPVSDLVSGNILEVLGQSENFYKVSFPDKRIAYIPVKKAQKYSQWESRPNPEADQILKSARSMLGVPYLWGGTSIKGVDCSGFTKTTYLLNGIVLPRDASQQALVGDKIDIYESDTVNIAKCVKNLKAGDLLFFASDKKTLRVTHTAIYIGNGEFIQAAGLVRINSMLSSATNYADFQSRTLVSARRILTSIGKHEITRVDQHPYYKQTEE